VFGAVLLVTAFNMLRGGGAVTPTVRAALCL
jgi:hypothetical protein